MTRTCLLCGGPLGRIRVGAGGDFCSREHRNQYRLKRSMDCLTEANKVATLARRRENPKPLFTTNPEASLPVSRACVELKSFNLDAAPKTPVRQTAFCGAPQLSVAPATPVAVGEQSSKSARRTAGPIPIESSQAPRIMGGSRVWTLWKPALRPQSDGLLGVRISAPGGRDLRVACGAAFRPNQPGRSKYPVCAWPGIPGLSTNAFRAEPGLRLHPLQQNSRVIRDDARLAFVELPFTGALEQPARMDWVEARHATAPARSK